MLKLPWRASERRVPKLLTRVEASALRHEHAPRLSDLLRDVRPTGLEFDLGALSLAQTIWALPLLDALLRRLPGLPVSVRSERRLGAALLSAHVQSSGYTLAPIDSHPAESVFAVRLGSLLRGEPRWLLGPRYELHLSRWRPRRLAYAPPPTHAAEHWHEQAFLIGLDTDGGAPRLGLTKEAKATGRLRVAALLPNAGPLIVILPAHRATRSFGIERLHAAAAQVQRRIGGRVVQLGGPCLADSTRLPRHADVAALLHFAAVCIADDIGWAHVAAAVGAPVVTVHGRTCPQRCGPASRVGATVWAAASDCQHDGGAEKPPQRCLRCVTSEQVAAVAERISALHWPRDRMRRIFG